MKKAKRFLSVLLTLCMVLGLLPGAALAANSKPFSDVDADDWFSGAVQYVYENGMMSGTGEDTFSPNATTTRGMIVTILHSMEGKPAVSGKTFTDVAQGQYYAAAVAWASANGIVSGYDDGRFGPNDPITREQLAAILFGYAKYKEYDVSVGEDTNILSYNDALEISEYAIPAMQWACGAGLISGMDNNMLAPTGSATRAQAATILMQFNNKAAQQDLCTVTFAYNSVGGVYKTVTVKTGEQVEPPKDNPVRSGYIFEGWFAQAEDGGRFLFTTPITQDVTVYAHWSKKSEGGGGGGGGGSSTVSLQSVKIQKGTESAEGAALKSGDVLTLSVDPANANYTVEWLAGGAKVADTASYTVSAMDVGKTITAKITGTGKYTGTVTSAATGIVTAVVDVTADDPDAAPVVIAADAAYKDADGKDITIDENSAITLEVSEVKNVQVSEETSDAVESSLFIEYEIPEADQADVPVNYVTVDADLTLTTTTTTENEETGETETTTEETEIHPVGTTTLTLSKENLGISAEEDIANYVFFAHHTNAAGEDEVIQGEVVTVDGEQRVRFTLNGLSRIYIGNVPPLTVTFDTKGGSEVPAQKVKLGGYATDVEPPVKSGWLFAGWDHDIQTENIIKDITVTALWIQGTTAADAQLTGQWQKDGQALQADPENVTMSKANGTVTLTLEDETEYPANLSYVLSVAPMEGAVKMAAATTAEGAMKAAEADYKDAESGVITAVVTDANGNVKTSNINLYIKWIGADGELLGLQSARLVVRTPSTALGNYDTQTRVENTAVNRGLGQVEFYLTNGTNEAGAAIPDYAGVINGYLNSNSNGYYLNLYGSFYENFWDSDSDEEYTGNNYTGVKVVIKPFEGERFSKLPTVEAYYEEEDATEITDYTSAVSAALVDGNIVLTCAKPAPEAEYVYLYFDLTLDGVTQSFSVDIDNYLYSNENWTRLTTDNWTEAVNALKNGTNQVYYHGAQSVTLNTVLTLNPEQALYFNNYNSEVSLTIGQGGKLTLEGDDLHGADVYVWNGELIVADGGVLTTNSQDPEQNRYHNVGVRADQGVTVKQGGALKVPQYGYMRIYNCMGGFTLEQGGTLTNECMLYVDRDAESNVPNVLAGTVTKTNSRGYLEFNDGLTIAPTGEVTISDNGRFEVYGGLIVQEGGKVTCDTGRRITLSGRSENYGTITMGAGTLEMWNTGYSVYNDGTISVASGARMNIEGTVLVNTGALTGSGTLYTYELNDASSYDNGIEYVEVEENSDRTPSNYDRYQFVKDPSATVDVIYFIGELANRDGGTSTLTQR